MSVESRTQSPFAPVARTLDLPALKAVRLDRDKLVAMFRELEFNRLMSKLPGPEAAPAAPVALPERSQQLSLFPEVQAPVTDAAGQVTELPPGYHLVATRAELEALVRRLNEVEQFAIDTEGTAIARNDEQVGRSYRFIVSGVPKDMLLALANRRNVSRVKSRNAQAARAVLLQPDTGTQAALRVQMRKADKLLQDAGWVVMNGHRVSRDDPEKRMTFEIILTAVEDKKVVATIPIHFTGTAAGVKGGGKLVTKMKSLKVKTYPKYLKEFIDVDLTNLELNQNIRVEDVKDPNYEILNSPRIPIASVVMTRQLKQEEAAATPAAAAPAKTGAAAPAAPAKAAPAKK